MIEIREATEKDNEALIELQKRCPQGTNFILGIDSSPDYFARSRPFTDWRIFVATEDESIVGSAACAISYTKIEGKQFKTAYEYGFIVDPYHRRKGIAIKLQEHIEDIASEKNVDLLHLDITEDNVPSINLFSRMGFKKVKDCTTFSLMVYRKQRIFRKASIRKMEKKDADEVTNFLNEMYQDYNFFTPFKTNDFIEYVRRVPYFDFQNIQIFEDDEGIKACLGYWDYNKVRKYIVQKFNWKLNVQIILMRLMGLFMKMPKIPSAGEPLLSYNLTTLAYQDSECMIELIKHIINLALENKINFLHVPLDPETPSAMLLSKFRHTKVMLHFLIKSLKQKTLPNLGERKLYIDISEI